MQKNDKEQAAWMMHPGTESKEEKKEDELNEFKDEDGIIDPDLDTHNVTGRDPDEMTPEQMDNLRGYVKQYEAVGDNEFIEEFETYSTTPISTKVHEDNPTNNRYKDTFCADQTRIPLTYGSGGDCIHANRVPMGKYDDKGKMTERYFMNKFITTQGSIEGTVKDVWRLVVQEDVGYIFMLCSIDELEKKKCEVYYPENKETLTYNDTIKVTLVDKHEDGHFINSKFILEVPNKPKRYVYHHYWKNWLERESPHTVCAALRLLRYARLSNFSTLVHCSEGSGRTGTFVALEWLLQQICVKPPPYDMKAMLTFMRDQCAHALQSDRQYTYIMFAVFVLQASKDSTTVLYRIPGEEVPWTKKRGVRGYPKNPVAAYSAT